MSPSQLGMGAGADGGERGRRGVADGLRGLLPAEDWPDFWHEADSGPLPEGLTVAERRDLYQLATLAARERWRELVIDERGDQLEEQRRAAS